MSDPRSQDEPIPATTVPLSLADFVINSGTYVDTVHEQPQNGAEILDDPSDNTNVYLDKIDHKLSQLPADEKAPYLLALFKDSVTDKDEARQTERTVKKFQVAREAKLRELNSSR